MASRPRSPKRNRSNDDELTAKIIERSIAGNADGRPDWLCVRDPQRRLWTFGSWPLEYDCKSIAAWICDLLKGIEHWPLVMRGELSELEEKRTDNECFSEITASLSWLTKELWADDGLAPPPAPPRARDLPSVKQFLLEVKHWINVRPSGLETAVPKGTRITWKDCRNVCEGFLKNHEYTGDNEMIRMVIGRLGSCGKSTFNKALEKSEIMQRKRSERYGASPRYRGGRSYDAAAELDKNLEQLIESAATEEIRGNFNSPEFKEQLARMSPEKRKKLVEMQKEDASQRSQFRKNKLSSTGRDRSI
jgi:hypothetical protein